MLTTATMNGMSVPPPHSQLQHDQAGSPQVPLIYAYPSVPHYPPQSIMFRPPSNSVGSVSSTVSTVSSVSTHHKRGRVGSEASSTSVLSYQNHLQQQFHSQHPPPNSHVVQVVQYAFEDNQYDDDERSYGSSVTPKKARPSSYQPPRSVKPSLLSAMGTLASPKAAQGANINASSTSQFCTSASTTTTNTATNTHVPMRRRLSGGHLEEYLGNHNDAMDGMDTSGDNRPRSMSF